MHGDACGSRHVRLGKRHENRPVFAAARNAEAGQSVSGEQLEWIKERYLNEQ